jgi:transposase
MNAATFEEWVEKCLAPTLSKGDVVVMGNPSSHTGIRVEELINAVGATLKYLPPHSPDLNPIEKAFSQLKSFLRDIAERSVAGLLNALEARASFFKPVQCVNDFEARGYDASGSDSALACVLEQIPR